MVMQWLVGLWKRINDVDNYYSRPSNYVHTSLRSSVFSSNSNKSEVTTQGSAGQVPPAPLPAPYHKSQSSGKRGHHLKNNIHQIDLWDISGIFS